MPSFVKAWKYTGEPGVFAAGNSNSLTTLIPMSMMHGGTLQFLPSDISKTAPFNMRAANILTFQSALTTLMPASIRGSGS